MAQSASIPTGGGADEVTASPFRVDPDDEIPVGVQLEWRLRSLIASGHLAQGERLPSVRALADWAGVNVNTVRSVYAGLESRGVVATQHGSGTFVVAPGFSAELERIAMEAIAEARQLGASPRELAMVAFVCAEVEPAPGSEAESRGDSDTRAPGVEKPRLAREELRRQIGRLESQLAAHSRELPAANEPHLPAMARVAGIEQLERTRDELIARLAEARESAENTAAQQRRARQIREEMLIDPASRRWQQVSDAEMGEEGCRDYAVGAGPLGSLMSWWRLKVSGGCPLSGSARGG